MRRASAVNILPSCPPPRTPSVAPGRITRGREASRHERLRRDRSGSRSIVMQKRCVGSRQRIAIANRAALWAPASPIASVATGMPFRQLHDGKERIESLEMLARDRDAEYRDDRLGREHAGKMRCAAGAGDDAAQPARLGLFGVAEEQVRRPMCRHDDGSRRERRIQSGARPHAA